jgi:hypothetical protein
MNARFVRLGFCAVMIVTPFTRDLCGQSATSGIVLVRHAPSIGGTVEGSIQQMSGESVTLNGSAVITGDLLVPGMPSVRLNGKLSYLDTTDATGASTPGSYEITVGGNSRLQRVVRRTDPWGLPVVNAPASPAGTRRVTVNSSTTAVGDFATVRDLTLNGNAGQVVVPPGHYGEFSASGSNAFAIGITGGTEPAAYSFQRLTLTGSAGLRILGPVVVTLANGAVVNGAIGTAGHPEWLALRISKGDLTLNGGATLMGYVMVPAGEVTLNGSSRITGGVISDRLTLTGGSVLQLFNQGPTAVITTPIGGTVLTAPVAMLAFRAAATDADGYVNKVVFAADRTTLGQSAAPYALDWQNVAVGTYHLTAIATDNAGASTSSLPITLVVNAPPTVALTAPMNRAIIAAPASVTLVADASDVDGTITSVEFFQGSTRLVTLNTTSYRHTTPPLPPDNYTFTARATDNRGATTTSSAVSVLVDALPITTVTPPPSSLAEGQQVTLTGTATDSDGTITKLELLRDTLVAATLTPSGAGNSFALTDPSRLTPGKYSYVVRTYDNTGLFGDSAAVLVTILPVLPYLADFEAREGYQLGPLDQRLGWTASGSAAVTDQAFYSGTRSVALNAATPAPEISQVFAPPSGRTVVFVDFFAQPVAEVDTAASTTFEIEGARFALRRNGTGGEVAAFNGDGNGGGAWQTTRFTSTLTNDNRTQDWIRFTARLDFSSKRWDLYVAANMVAADLGLLDRSANYLSTFKVRGATSGASRLDYLFAAAENPLFVDANFNGIEDGWETAHGLALTDENRNGDLDGDGVSNVQELANGTDPTDFYNGVLPVLTSLVENGRVGTDGLVAVKVTRASDGVAIANAPVTLAVTTGGASIAATIGGATVPQISVRTDAQGVARGYVTFTGTSDVLVATAKSGVSIQSIPIPIAPATDPEDTDGNGMADRWETVYFNQPGADPNADADGDGLTNLQEYNGRTDPTDFFNGVEPITEAGNGGAPDAAGALTMIVRKPDGTVWANAPVTFRITKGDRRMSATPGGPAYSMELTVRTNTGGVAKVYLEPL